MNRSLLTLLVLVFLLMTLLSPFSALSMLMLVLFASAIFWAIATLVQTAISGEPKKSS